MQKNSTISIYTLFLVDQTFDYLKYIIKYDST